MRRDDDRAFIIAVGRWLLTSGDPVLAEVGRQLAAAGLGLTSCVSWSGRPAGTLVVTPLYGPQLETAGDLGLDEDTAAELDETMRRAWAEYLAERLDGLDDD